MQIALLSGSDVFAVCCSVADGKLAVGILVLSEDFEPGMHQLWPETGEPIAVVIPSLPVVSYGVEFDAVVSAV